MKLLSGILSLGAPSTKTISIGVAALGTLAVSAQANAADIYGPGPGGFKDVPIVAPIPTWTGFYAGINMGAAWSDLNINRIYEPNGTGGYYTACTPATGGGFCLGGNNLNSTNAFGGGQFGYNWQGWGSFVFGLEVDLEGVGGGNERSSFAVQNNKNLVSASFKQDGGFAGDITGRLGYAWGNWMLYAKGGFAWFNPQISAHAAVYNPSGTYQGSLSNFDNNTTLTGWTIGGGVEWLLNPNWSVKVEYLYYDFGNNDNVWNASWCPTGGACANYASWRLFNNDLTVNTVKLGVNYHLTSGYVPLK